MPPATTHHGKAGSTTGAVSKLYTFLFGGYYLPYKGCWKSALLLKPTILGRLVFAFIAEQFVDQVEGMQVAKKKPTKKVTVPKVKVPPVISARVEHVWHQNGLVGIRVWLDGKEQDLVILDNKSDDRVEGESILELFQDAIQSWIKQAPGYDDDEVDET